MQKWEYKTVFRTRGWTERAKNTAWHWSGPWDPGGDITPQLEKMGEEGWELVAISPRSGVVGGYTGYENVFPPNYAGFTSEEVWVFKRPKP